jgi:hypothetical protein
MHSVIRKRQGLPYVPEEPRGLFHNARLLSAVEAKAQPFPPDDLGLAFGDRQHPKLVKQCTAEDAALRNRALAHVCQQVKYARETASFLPAGLVPALNSSAEHATDAESRTLATAALARLSLEGNGREHMLLPGPSASVPTLLRLAVDPEPAVRQNALSCARQLGREGAGAQALVEGGAVALLVARCTAEKGPGLLAPVLAALEIILRTSHAGLAEAIAGGAIAVVCGLLASAIDSEACERACYCLATLTDGIAEKRAAVDEGVVPRLLACLSGLRSAEEAEEEAPEGRVSLRERVATAATAALMSLSIDNDCKATAVQAGAVRALEPLLLDAVARDRQDGLGPANSTLIQNATKLLANLAEEPKGRKQLQRSLKELQPLAACEEPLLQKNAAIAIQKVTWKP